VLKEQINSGEINLTAIVNTHQYGTLFTQNHHHILIFLSHNSHWDHAGGNKKLLAQSEFSGKPVIGGKDCEAVTKTPANGETFNIGSITVKALYTPCHTKDSICWFMQDGEEKAVFTGDTLFHGGCGRFFQGTPEQMHTALNKTLASLPDDTKVYVSFSFP
jgi:hydroxyacylglutathione hydrolase